MYGVRLHERRWRHAGFQPFNSLVLMAILALAPFREPVVAVFAGSPR